MWKCAKCGKEFEDTDNKCWACGTSGEQDIKNLATNEDVKGKSDPSIPLRPMLSTNRMICPKCKKGYDDTWKVCLDCGSPLTIHNRQELEDTKRMGQLDDVKNSDINIIEEIYVNTNKLRHNYDYIKEAAASLGTPEQTFYDLLQANYRIVLKNPTQNDIGLLKKYNAEIEGMASKSDKVKEIKIIMEKFVEEILKVVRVNQKAAPFLIGLICIIEISFIISAIKTGDGSAITALILFPIGGMFMIRKLSTSRYLTSEAKTYGSELWDIKSNNLENYIKAKSLFKQEKGIAIDDKLINGFNPAIRDANIRALTGLAVLAGSAWVGYKVYKKLK